MIYRRYQPEDKTGVLSVLGESIPEWRGDWAGRYWEWKFEKNPHGEGLVWVGDDQGRIAGCYIWNPVRIRLGSMPMLGAQSVDAAVHPDYRGHGLFTELARTAKEDIAGTDLAVVYAFPVEAAFRGQVRIGFEPRLTISPVHRPLLTGLRRRPFPRFTLDDAIGFGSEFDVFSEHGREGELTILRDAAYLRWRYDEHPTRTYETLVCLREGQLCGYCVLSVDDARRVSRGYVIDLQVLPDDEEAAAFLAYQALKRLRSRGARVAISWPRPSGPEQTGLVSLGFSARYQAIRARLEREHYVPQFLVYENPGGSLDQARASGDVSDPTWSLVPGDHDST